MYYGCFRQDTSKSLLHTDIYFQCDNLQNGDAKFYKDKILTSVNGKFTIIDLSTKDILTYSNINSNWIDVDEKNNIVIYGNLNKELGIFCLKENEINENYIINQDETFKIDPCIIEIDNEFYITYTQIEGTVNNSNIKEKNGLYTIKMYKSDDLKDWVFVGNIIQENYNLEDVKLYQVEESIFIIYEKEVLDKGKSGVYVSISKDKGKTWSKEIELLSQIYDNEPAIFGKTKDDIFYLYYSCDKAFLGESYMGGQIYMAIYDSNLECIKSNILIDTETEKGILLYDVEISKNKIRFLYSKDYLTNCDLIAEKGVYW